MDLKNLQTDVTPPWCPGCGLWVIHNALKQALINIEAKPEKTCIVGGIGCGGQMPHWINTYGIDTLHGRALPVASAIKLCNRGLKVIAFGGDGDGYGIGMGHFIHSMRRNLDLTYLVNDNMVYGLTQGQTAPTSPKGFKSKSTPFGVIEPAINPIALALTSNCTFVARGSAADLNHLTNLIEKGLRHKGFALIDILQPCVIFNKNNSFQYLRENTYKLEDEGHNPKNFKKALEKALETKSGAKIPIGVFYQEERPTYEDELPQIAEKALVDQNIENIKIEHLLDKYA